MSNRPPRSPDEDPSFWEDDNNTSPGDQLDDGFLAHDEPPPPPPPDAAVDTPPPPPPLMGNLSQTASQGEGPQQKSLFGEEPTSPSQVFSDLDVKMPDWIVRKWGDVQSPPPDDPQNLLGNGFLRRGGASVLAGPAGSGKSALALQLCATWALGRPALGIQPQGELKILVIQAENDDRDMAEIRDGVCAGLKLSLEERERVCSSVQLVTECSSFGVDFILGLERILQVHHPDLIVIDPLFAFFGGSIAQQSEVSKFLRAGMNALLQQNQCAALIVHHINKPGRDQSGKPVRADNAYAMSGSAEIVNWARAVLILSAVNEDGVYELVAAKRGKRIGWENASGHANAPRRMIRHSNAGIIYWEEVPAEEAAQMHPKMAGKHELLELIPYDDPIAKAVIITMAKDELGMGVNCAGKLLATLLHEKRIREVHVGRAGKRPEVRLVRVEAGEEDIPEFPKGWTPPE